MTNTEEQVMVGGKGILRWFNDMYNYLFGSLFGYTDIVQLGGRKTRIHRRTMRKNRSHKRR